MSEDRLAISTAVRGRRPSVRAAIWAGALTAAMCVFTVVDPGQFEIAVVVWAILIGLIVLAYASSVMLRHVPLQQVPRRQLELPRFRRRQVEREVAPGLREMERMVIFGQASAYDFESRLRPHLVGIAEQRLVPHGLTLHSSPERVRALLGADTWELVRPDYQARGDRRRYGIPWNQLLRAVEGLDAL